MNELPAIFLGLYEDDDEALLGKWSSDIASGLFSYFLSWLLYSLRFSLKDFLSKKNKNKHYCKYKKNLFLDLIK